MTPTGTSEVVAMNQEVAGQVRQFIRQNFYLEEGLDLGDDVSLVAGGLVDSTGMLEVIVFIEEKFGIKIGDDEVVPSNLESIGRISAFVTRKQGRVAA
jgi:acyl carrier protein